jgi:hypothetical protein
VGAPVNPANHRQFNNLAVNYFLSTAKAPSTGDGNINFDPPTYLIGLVKPFADQHPRVRTNPLMPDAESCRLLCAAFVHPR